jgi:hypothetical protein
VNQELKDSGQDPLTNSREQTELTDETLGDLPNQCSIRDPRGKDKNSTASQRKYDEGDQTFTENANERPRELSLSSTIATKGVILSDPIPQNETNNILLAERSPSELVSSISDEGTATAEYIYPEDGLRA